VILKDPKPTGKRVLIQRCEPANTGTLIRTDDAMARAQAQIGQVIQVGDDNVHGLNPGDVVIYNRGAGLDISHLFNVRSTLLIIHQEQDVISKVGVSLVEPVT
jgi:co-chaperonin GroES (HSP10)